MDTPASSLGDSCSPSVHTRSPPTPHTHILAPGEEAGCLSFRGLAPGSCPPGRLIPPPPGCSPGYPLGYSPRQGEGLAILAPASWAATTKKSRQWRNRRNLLSFLWWEKSDQSGLPPEARTLPARPPPGSPGLLHVSPGSALVSLDLKSPSPL